MVLFSMINLYSEQLIVFKQERIPLFFVSKNSSSKLSLRAVNHCLVFERHRFVFQFTAFETDQSVGQCILLFGRNILLIILTKSKPGHYSSADNEVERTFLPLPRAHGGK